MVGYFKEIFSSSHPINLNYILNSVETYINLNMIQLLKKACTKDEIFQSIHQIHPTKSPDPNGMPAFSFYKFWHIVIAIVLHTMLSILNNNMDPSFINSTHIVLILKVTNPKTTKDFRPISLYNVILKIVTNIIANRLKKILPNIIHRIQSAFIPSRLITDKSLVAFKTFHFLKNKKGRKATLP